MRRCRRRPLPEIQRTSMATAVLYLKSLPLDIDVLAFDYSTPLGCVRLLHLAAVRLQCRSWHLRRPFPLFSFACCVQCD